MDTIIQPVTSKAKRGTYRQHSEAFKRAAVARTLVPGASVSLIARELKINTNQLFTWRKRFGTEAGAEINAPSQLLAVTVVDTPPAPAALASGPSGVIILSVGQVQLQLEGQVDAATLTLLLARLLS
ncbi:MULTISPECIES: transposase [unclassified Duganella]|uniref:transposase n=1 Tax=unclassified Duganella TaxID=2636909 RepID=UPI00088A1A24|nr:MULTISPECIES: transposase [unclassified Duganella]SDG83629.1 Transposase [Duganella sp. OV458]SDK11039.1 Transposase and inactivated derivatives [Duganella sp. OV510]